MQIEIIRQQAKKLANLATSLEAGPKLSRRRLRLAAECEERADDVARMLSDRRDFEERLALNHAQTLGWPLVQSAPVSRGARCSQVPPRCTAGFKAAARHCSNSSNWCRSRSCSEISSHRRADRVRLPSPERRSSFCPPKAMQWTAVPGLLCRKLQ